MTENDMKVLQNGAVEDPRLMEGLRLRFWFKVRVDYTAMVMVMAMAMAQLPERKLNLCCPRLVVGLEVQVLLFQKGRRLSNVSDTVRHLLSVFTRYLALPPPALTTMSPFGHACSLSMFMNAVTMAQIFFYGLLTDPVCNNYCHSTTTPLCYPSSVAPYC